MGRVIQYLREVGPGAIVASATIGAGETVLAVRAGAWGGYQLLWLILLAVISKSFLTLYLLGRYSAVTGRPVAEKLVEFPGPRGWFLWAVLLLEGLVAPFVFVVIAVPCGRLMAQILASVGLQVSYVWLAIAFVTLAIGVGMLQQYQTLEKSQFVVCLVLLFGTLAATWLARPDFWGVFKGLLSVGQVPPYPDWLPSEIRSRSRLLEMASVFGYAGSIPMNYIVYSNWVLLKGWVGRKGGSGREGLSLLRWDVGFNALLVFFVTGAFLVAGAAILRPLQRIPSGYDLLTEQANIFARISPAMIPLYYVVILASLWGTLNALPDIYARGAHSFLKVLVPAYRNLSYRSVMNIFGPVMLLLTWLTILRGTTPIVMIDLVALFSTNLGVGLTCLGGIWLNAQLPAERRVSSALSVLAWFSALLISVMALLSAREVVAKYLW